MQHLSYIYRALPLDIVAVGFKDVRFSQQRVKRSSIVSPALAETAVSIAIAATVVGTAATLLARRSTKASEEAEV